MIKGLLKKFIYNKLIARLIIKKILRIHTLSYKLSGIYSSILNNDSHPKHKIVDYFKWYIDNIDSSDIIVDIGCNKGYMANVMSQKAKKVYGIEILNEFVEHANKYYKSNNLIFYNADATKFDFQDLKYIPTVFTLSNVLEHIENRVQFLIDIQKKLKSKVKFLIRVPMIDREWIVLYKKQLGLEYRLDKTHFIEYTFEKFKQEINASGLEIENYHIRWGELYAICK